MTSLRSRVLRLSVALATALPLTAQQTLTIRGELDEGRSTGCYYCPNVPYTVKFSETPVRSTTVNLAAYHAASQQLILTGIWDTSTNPPGLNVTSVAVVTESLSFPTNARVGVNERFDVYGPAAAASATLIGFGSGFTPLLGSALLLNPALLVMIDNGPLDATGRRRFDLPVPDNAALAGLNFWSQSLIVPSTGLPFFSNPGRTTVR